MEKFNQWRKNNTSFYNTIQVFMGKAFSMLFVIALDATIAKHLGVSGYAEWSFFMSIATIIFNISWFGVNSAGKVYIARNTGEKQKQYFNAAFFLRIVISSIFVLLMIFVIAPIMIKMGIGGNYEHFSLLLYLGSILLFFNGWSDFAKSMCQGQSEFGNLLLITIIEYGGYFFFSFLFLNAIESVYALIAGYIVTGVLEMIFSVFMLKRKGLAVDKKVLNKHSVREIFSYSVPLVATCMGELVLMEMDTVMMGILSNDVQISMYALAKNLCQKATHINLSFTIAVITTFALIDKKNVKTKFKLFMKYQLINAVIILFVVSVIGLGSPLYIHILYGEEFMEAVGIIRILLIYYVLETASGFYTFLLDYQKKGWIRSFAFIIVIVLDFVLNYLWIPKYGAMGAVVATICSIIPYVVIVIFSGLRIFKKIADGEENTNEKRKRI